MDSEVVNENEAEGPCGQQRERVERAERAVLGICLVGTNVVIKLARYYCTRI